MKSYLEICKKNSLHLADIKSLEQKGVMDSIVGKALYEGTITLEEIAEYNQQK